jgi:Cu2+-containing amine oxidase
VAVVLALAVCAAPLSAARQVHSADEKEIYNYILTMDMLRKVMRAMKSMAAGMMDDPKYKEVAALEAEIKKLEEKDQTLEAGLPEAEQERLENLRTKLEALENAEPDPMANAQTLTEMEAAVRKTPALATALQREGITPREYSKFWLTFLTAGLAHGLQKTYGPSKEAAKTVSPANLEFFRQNEKEIEALTKEFEQFKPTTK